MTLFPIFVVATQNSRYIMKEDQILIEQLNASSIEAFSALYDKYAGMVFNFTHAILKDTYLSEDITQSCFALMWIRRTSISPEGNVPAWLYVVARNAGFHSVYEFQAMLADSHRCIDPGSLWGSQLHCGP